MRTSFLVIFALFSASVLAKGPEDTIVEYFLSQVIQANYWQWINENNLDPTPIRPNKSISVGWSNSTDNIDGTFSDFTVANLGAPESTWNIKVKVDLEHRTIFMENWYMGRMPMESAVPQGKYKINGTIKDVVHVEGEGRWAVNLTGLAVFMHHIQYENFNISEDGFIDLSNSDTFSQLNPGVDYQWGGRMELILDGLTARGWEDQIKTEVFRNWRESTKELSCSMDNPFLGYFDEWLGLVFATTPIEEMFKFNEQARLGLKPKFNLGKTRQVTDGSKMRQHYCF